MSSFRNYSKQRFICIWKYWKPELTTWCLMEKILQQILPVIEKFLKMIFPICVNFSSAKMIPTPPINFSLRRNV